MKPRFKTSALAALTSLFTYSAQAEMHHDLIKLTPELANKYQGNGVKLGILDSGFILGHPNLDPSKFTTKPFESITPDGYKEFFDPNEDIVNVDEEGEGIYSTHGGAVSALINGKKGEIDDSKFVGGVAPNAHIVVADDTPFDSEVPEDGEEGQDPNESNESGLVSNSPAARYSRSVTAKALNDVLSESVFAINNSWGIDDKGDFSEDFYRTELSKPEINENELINAIKNGVKNHKTLFVFASGNSAGRDPDIMASLRYSVAVAQRSINQILLQSL